MQLNDIKNKKKIKSKMFSFKKIEWMKLLGQNIKKNPKLLSGLFLHQFPFVMSYSFHIQGTA